MVFINFSERVFWYGCYYFNFSYVFLCFGFGIISFGFSYGFCVFSYNYCIIGFYRFSKIFLSLLVIELFLYVFN